MLLANVAWQLASAGQKVLLIDWDLEAPGLHRYFRPFLGEDVELREQRGVLEWVTDYWEARIDAPNVSVADLVVAEADPRNYVRRLNTEGFINDGSIDLMCSGRQDRHYAQAVADFDWTRLYEKLSGEEFIAVAKEMLVGVDGYDYVLVDSRTGVSDTSGFCTVALADTLVVCFTYNNQSVIGASNAARDITQQAHNLRERQQAGSGSHRQRRRFRLFAVPSRVDDLDRERLERREQQAWGLFNNLLTDVSSDQRDAYWGSVAIRNHGQFAYEEVLAVCMNRATETQGMLGSVSNITRELTDGRFCEPNSLTDEQRRILREAFSAHANNALEQAQDVWSTVLARLPEPSARDSLLQTCFPLLVQLYEVAPLPERVVTESAAPVLRVSLSDLDMTPRERQMADLLTEAGITQRRITQDGQRALRISHDSVLTHWKSLRERLLEQLPFMEARDQVAKARSSWESAGSTFEGLSALVGDVAGLDFDDEQAAWLGRPNLKFLAAIRAAHSAQDREQSLRMQVAKLQDAERTARAEWDTLRSRLEHFYEDRLAKHTIEVQEHTATATRRQYRAVRYAIFLGFLSILLPVAVEWRARASVQAIAEKRDAAVLENRQTAAQLLALQAKVQDDAALLAYGIGYDHMTRFPARLRRLDLAINAFSEAIKANPQFAEAYQARAVARARSGDKDKLAEIADWAEYCNLRPSLDRRIKFLSWALLTPGADKGLLRNQLTKLVDDSRDPAYRDMSPAEAARRLTSLLDRIPTDLRADAEAAAAALRSTSSVTSGARPEGVSTKSTLKGFDQPKKTAGPVVPKVPSDASSANRIVEEEEARARAAIEARSKAPPRVSNARPNESIDAQRQSLRIDKDYGVSPPTELSGSGARAFRAPVPAAK
jgi:MinD-like ATPase involved in chromosome partitioning or flagellar assembly/DNA-binding CsgD family transcriptional regulator